MKKADKLRAALRDAGSDGISSADIKRITGAPGSISSLCKTGEAVAKDTAEGKRYTLNPDFVPARQRKVERQLPIKRKTKRAKGKKKHARKVRQTRPFKALAEKHTAPASQSPLLGLLYDNLIAGAENLAATLRREVEGVETNPTLIAAIEQQERATQMARATLPARTA